jgi:hypothetical protein
MKNISIILNICGVAFTVISLVCVVIYLVQRNTELERSYRVHLENEIIDTVHVSSAVGD